MYCGGEDKDVLSLLRCKGLVDLRGKIVAFVEMLLYVIGTLVMTAKLDGRWLTEIGVVGLPRRAKILKNGR